MRYRHAVGFTSARAPCRSKYETSFIERREVLKRLPTRRFSSTLVYEPLLVAPNNAIMELYLSWRTSVQRLAAYMLYPLLKAVNSKTIEVHSE